MSHSPERRPAQRKAFCRACDQLMNPGTEMISWYSPANRGMHIHLCLPCAIRIGQMAADAPGTNEPFEDGK